MLTYLLSLLFLLPVHQYVFSQAGTVDSSFNDIGLLPGPYSAFTVQPDGKILTASSYYDQPQNKLLLQLNRFNKNGGPDSSFGTNGFAFADIYSSTALIKVCPDGKIVLLCGNLDSFYVLRFYPDGRTDNNFDLDGNISLGFLTSQVYITDMEILPNGKILLAGSRDYAGSNADRSFFITRLNIDGSADTHFGNNGVVTTIFNVHINIPEQGIGYNDVAVIKDIQLQADGKIVAVGGVAVWLNGYSNDSIAVVRYNTDGIPDSSFALNGKFTLDPSTPYNQNNIGYGAYGHSVVIQPDGKIVIGASCYYSQSHGVWFYSNLAVIRLTGNGTLDNSFDLDGMKFMELAPYNFYLKAELQSNNKILICTTTGSGRDGELYSSFVFTRILADGNIDGSFGENGVVVPFPEADRIFFGVNAMEMYAGRIYVNGVLNQNSGGLWAFKNDGIYLKPQKVSLCSTTSEATIASDLQGTNYQWQQSTDSLNFYNVSNGANYSGVTTATLLLNNISLALNGYQFRCIVDNTQSNIISIHLPAINEAEWTGAVSTNWEDPANWLCNQIPASNAEVIINSGNVTINSNVIIQGLYVKPGASLKVNAGYTLEVLNKSSN